jgi:hypothetical protein
LRFLLATQLTLWPSGLAIHPSTLLDTRDPETQSPGCVSPRGALPIPYAVAMPEVPGYNRDNLTLA